MAGAKAVSGDRASPNKSGRSVPAVPVCGLGGWQRARLAAGREKRVPLYSVGQR